MKIIAIILLFIASITTIVFLVGKTLLNDGFTPSLIAASILIFASIASYFLGDKIIIKSYSAKKILKEANPALFQVTEHLCAQLSLQIPNVYVINTQTINAFSVGRDPKHAAICLTSGALGKLEKAELEGILAHELSHIKNNEILSSSLVAMLLGFMLRHIFPLNSLFFHVVLSQKREYEADAFAALITRFPQGLASALEKISQDQTPLRFANVETARLFIENPFRGSNSKWFSGLFNIHPPIEERIRLLRSI